MVKNRKKIKHEKSSIPGCHLPENTVFFDKDGNYFDLDSSLLYEGMQYKPVLKLNAKGEILHYDRPNDWKFQIGDVFDINYKSGY